jgi:hypothetical protein
VTPSGRSQVIGGVTLKGTGDFENKKPWYYWILNYCPGISLIDFKGPRERAFVHGAHLSEVIRVGLWGGCRALCGCGDDVGASSLPPEDPGLMTAHVLVHPALIQQAW